MHIKTHPTHANGRLPFAFSDAYRLGVDMFLRLFCDFCFEDDGDDSGNGGGDRGDGGGAAATAV